MLDVQNFPNCYSRKWEWVESEGYYISMTYVIPCGHPVPVEGQGQGQFLSDLPPIPSGEEVLARWSDDGWYYRGM